jgi:hypothetical protein
MAGLEALALVSEALLAGGEADIDAAAGATREATPPEALDDFQLLFAGRPSPARGGARGGGRARGRARGRGRGRGRAAAAPAASDYEWVEADHGSSFHDDAAEPQAHESVDDGTDQGADQQPPPGPPSAADVQQSVIESIAKELVNSFPQIASLLGQQQGDSKASSAPGGGSGNGGLLASGVAAALAALHQQGQQRQGSGAPGAHADDEIAAEAAAPQPPRGAADTVPAHRQPSPLPLGLRQRPRRRVFGERVDDDGSDPEYDAAEDEDLAGDIEPQEGRRAHRAPAPRGRPRSGHGGAGAHPGGRGGRGGPAAAAEVAESASATLAAGGSPLDLGPGASQLAAAAMAALPEPQPSFGVASDVMAILAAAAAGQRSGTGPGDWQEPEAALGAAGWRLHVPPNGLTSPRPMATLPPPAGVAKPSRSGARHPPPPPPPPTLQRLVFRPGGSRSGNGNGGPPHGALPAETPQQLQRKHSGGGSSSTTPVGGNRAHWHAARATARAAAATAAAAAAEEAAAPLSEAALLARALAGSGGVGVGVPAAAGLLPGSAAAAAAAAGAVPLIPLAMPLPLALPTGLPAGLTSALAPAAAAAVREQLLRLSLAVRPPPLWPPPRMRACGDPVPKRIVFVWSLEDVLSPLRALLRGDFPAPPVGRRLAVELRRAVLALADEHLFLQQVGALVGGFHSRRGHRAHQPASQPASQLNS